MSLCRFWWDGSDVYVYESDRGLECCGCFLFDNFHTTSEGEMVAHLNQHVSAGHVVPTYAYEDLNADHPDPESAQKARDKWCKEYPEYSWTWEGDSQKRARPETPVPDGHIRVLMNAAYQRGVETPGDVLRALDAVDIWLKGLPAQSNSVEALRELVSHLWVHCDTAYAEQQMTTEQREMFRALTADDPTP